MRNGPLLTQHFRNRRGWVRTDVRCSGQCRPRTINRPAAVTVVSSSPRIEASSRYPTWHPYVYIHAPRSILEGLCVTAHPTRMPLFVWLAEPLTTLVIAVTHRSDGLIESRHHGGSSERHPHSPTRSCYTFLGFIR